MASKWVVKTMQNLTACDTIFRGGSTQRQLGEDAFDTEEEAEAYYNKQKNMFRFASLAGQYVTYPVLIENYEPTVIPEHHCDICGEGIEKENDHYLDLDGGDFCSKSCFNNRMRNSHDEERYYED